MDHLGLVPVQEANGVSSCYWREASSAVPQAMEGLQGTSPPPFLSKICDIVDDSNTNHIVSWGKDNNSFVVWDPDAFALQLLPKYFKHSKLSSFIRQLNTYGFRKVDPDKLEFASEWFLRGQRHLLKQVRRRKPPSNLHHPLQGPSESCVEVVRCGSEVGTDGVRFDKEVLRAELVRLAQEIQNTKAHLRAMKSRLKETEIKQQDIMAFMAKMIRNPSSMQKLAKSFKRDKLVEAVSKKRSKASGHVYGGVEVRRRFYAESGRKDFGDIKVPVIKTLSLKKQELKETYEESQQRYEKETKGLDKQFWQDLLNNWIKEESGLFSVG
ncbi:hypothetical protein ACET3Z_032618 [Daucus carota]